MLAALICLMTGGGIVPAVAGDEPSALRYQTYVDVGYAASNRDPSDDNWPGKTSTATLNELTLNLAMANIGRDATRDARWGFELGLQAGDDSKRLVTSSPPPANEPLSNADDLRHLYRANISYLFGEQGSLRVTGGLINSYIGYESYLAIDNPNYTRAYLSDTVPYFLFGAEALWEVNETTDLGFYLVNGFNYLTDPNDIPSLGFSGKFQLSSNTKFVQNFYYGSDQKETDLEFWRFFTNSIVEWKSSQLTIAGSLDYGTEKQGDQPDEPRYQWTTAAVWINWAVNERLSLAFRPEFHWDSDGLATGAEQDLQAYTGTVKYQFLPRNNRLVLTLELRHDKTSGSEGGFPDEPNDEFKDDQALLLAGFLWTFAR
jgi:hypothetical protein